MITRRDQAVVAALVLALGVLGLVISAPAPPAEAVVATPTPLPTVEVATYREGVIGAPSSINPITARSRSERTLVGLLFSGLTRIAPDGRPEPDLAESWQSTDGGRVWTFRLRDDATWHDGVPVTADDVAVTVAALKDPAAPGPSAASWSEVRTGVIDPHTVRFTLATPLAAFAEAASQPLLPAHLLADVPVAELAADPFNQHPIGTGPYALERLDEGAAYLESVALLDGTLGQPAEVVPTDSLATVAPNAVPETALPYLPRIEISFYQDADSLEQAFRAGAVDVASGLGPAATAALVADVGGAREIRYPSTTLAAILLDQRPVHAELRDVRIRRGLLAAVDRDAAITGALGGGGLRADVPYPPTAPLYDADVATAVPYDVAAAATLLEAADWKKADGRWIAPAKSEPYRIELLTPDRSASPTVYALAETVAAAWTTFGLGVDLVALDPATLATRLEEGAFGATVVDIRLGPELDLYPLLASSQTKTGGANLVRYQDPGLDRLLTDARVATDVTARRAAVSHLLAKLASDVPLLPLAWRDEPVAVRGLVGVWPRLVVDPGDRFRDVLTWRLAPDR